MWHSILVSVSIWDWTQPEWTLSPSLSLPASLWLTDCLKSVTSLTDPLTVFIHYNYSSILALDPKLLFRPRHLSGPACLVGPATIWDAGGAKEKTGRAKTILIWQQCLSCHGLQHNPPLLHYYQSIASSKIYWRDSKQVNIQYHVHHKTSAQELEPWPMQFGPRPRNRDERIGQVRWSWCSSNTTMPLF